MSLNEGLSKFHKSLTCFTATLSTEELEWSCNIIDISLNGCLLQFRHTWSQHNLDALYTLTIQPIESNSIIMNLSINHVIGNEGSFICEHLDADNNSRLYRLLGSAPETDKLLARELAELTHPI